MSARSQRVAVVTGASAGLGAAAARQLAERGWHVVASGRSPDKLAAVAATVRERTGVKIDTVPADFAVLADVQNLADTIRERHDQLDLLANNAGLIPYQRLATVDGHELTIQVNHLAPYLLTNLLWDRLGPGSRVVTTASVAHRAGHLDPADLDGTNRRWSRWERYGTSKLANILFTAELARRHPTAVATSFHPGAVRSDLFRRNAFIRLAAARMPGFVTADTAAARLLHLAAGDAATQHPGGYFSRNRPIRLTGPAADADLATRLWHASAAAVGLEP